MLWHLKSMASWLIVQQPVKDNNKEKSNLCITDPLWGEPIGFPSKKTSDAESISMLWSYDSEDISARNIQGMGKWLYPIWNVITEPFVIELLTDRELKSLPSIP